MSCPETVGRLGEARPPSERRTLGGVVAIGVEALDLAIAAARKAAGFAALLDLGWVYFRLLVLREPLAELHRGVPDPELAQTLWVLLMLIAAQGWDIPAERIRGHWLRLQAQLRATANIAPTRLRRSRPGLATIVVVRLSRFMDLCVAVANKLGAFAALCYLIYIAMQLVSAGATLRAMHPSARDPLASTLANLGVLFVVLGWWATPFEQIGVFWRRLRAPV